MLTCRCGRLPTAACRMCDRPVCDRDYSTTAGVSVVCREPGCWTEANEVADVLQQAYERMYSRLLARNRADQSRRPALPYDKAHAWLVRGCAAPQGFRWGSYAGREVAALAAATGRATIRPKVGLFGRRMTHWAVDPVNRYDSSDPDRRARERDRWQYRALTPDGSLHLITGGSGQRVRAERLSGQDDLLDADVVSLLIDRPIGPQSAQPTVGRFVVDSWLEAGKPPVREFAEDMVTQALASAGIGEHRA